MCLLNLHLQFGCFISELCTHCLPCSSIWMSYRYLKLFALSYCSWGSQGKNTEVVCHSLLQWELDHKEGWVPKNWCFQTVVLEKTLKSPLDSKEFKPVNPKGNQPWIFTGRNDGEAPILWPPDAKSGLIGKDPNSGKDWGLEDKGATEDEIIGWHHRLNGH